MMELRNTRNDNQRRKMNECIQLGRCPFCMEWLSVYHDAPVIKEGKFWIITANDDPYEGVEHHYLAICKRHITSIEELTLEEAGEKDILFAWLIKHLGVNYGAMFMRFGEMINTGATLAHLHAHLIVGSKKTESGEKLRVKVGYKKSR